MIIHKHIHTHTKVYSSFINQVSTSAPLDPNNHMGERDSKLKSETERRREGRERQRDRMETERDTERRGV